MKSILRSRVSLLVVSLLLGSSVGALLPVQGPTYPSGSANPFDYTVFPPAQYPGIFKLGQTYTLRDLFAASVLPAVLIRNTDPSTPIAALSDFNRSLRQAGLPVPVATGSHAYDAYSIADSMLFVRYTFPVIGALPNEGGALAAGAASRPTR